MPLLFLNSNVTRNLRGSFGIAESNYRTASCIHPFCELNVALLFHSGRKIKTYVGRSPVMSALPAEIEMHAADGGVILPPTGNEQ